MVRRRIPKDGATATVDATHVLVEAGKPTRIVNVSPRDEVHAAKVERVELEGSRRLLTVAPDLLAFAALTMPSATVVDVEGALVRMRPPDGATDALVAAAKACLLRSGALAVRVMPRARGAVLSTPPAAREPPKRHREVVLSLAAASPDAKQLCTLLNEIMDEVGI